MIRTIGVHVVGACALIGLASCAQRPPSPPHDGPVLSITLAPTLAPSLSQQTPRPLAPGAVALALAGLPPSELVRLRERLAAATDDVIRRAAPMLFVNLDDDASTTAVTNDEAGSLRPALPDFPALTAAANLSGSPWTASGISVDLGPTCLAASTRCVPLYAATKSDRLVHRARSLAWALTGAAIVRVSPENRPSLLRSLREKTLASTTIALVFDAPAGELDEERLGPLRNEARRVLSHLPAAAPSRAWVYSLATTTSHWKLPIALGRDEILVIPRLSALARMSAFEADVSAAGEFAWVSRPQTASALPR